MTTLAIILAALASVVAGFSLIVAYATQQKTGELMSEVARVQESFTNLKSAILTETEQINGLIQALRDQIAAIPSISPEDAAKLNALADDMDATTAAVSQIVADEPAEEPSETEEGTGTEG